MKLSVIVLVCDKDFKNAQKLVDNINSRVKVDHEVIIVDNRENREDKLELSDCEIFTKKENLCCFEGRRQAVLSCAKGDYVWFVDADDDVEEIAHFDFTEDLICFNYWCRTENDEKKVSCSNPYQCAYTASEAQFFSASWRNVLKNMVWNKFYKTSVLKDIYKHLPDGLKINFSEDTLLNILVLSQIKTIRFLRDYFYVYYFCSGDTNKEEYDSIEPLKRTMQGFDISLGLLSTWLTEEKQKISGISAVGFFKGSAEFWLKKILLCKENIRGDFVKDVLLPIYDRQMLRSTVSSMDISEEEKQTLFEVLKNPPLVLLGKGENEYTIEDIKNAKCEIWTVGTYPKLGADKYFEWHGIEDTLDQRKNIITEYPDYLRTKYAFLPLNNSIANMLCIAYEMGYTHIEILGCQMNTREEYIKQRPALALVIGYFMGKGLEINWIGSPENTHYGDKKQNDYTDK